MLAFLCTGVDAHKGYSVLQQTNAQQRYLVQYGKKTKSNKRRKACTQSLTNTRLLQETLWISGCWQVLHHIFTHTHTHTKCIRQHMQYLASLLILCANNLQQVNTQ